MSLKIYWSDRLEALAEKLFSDWEQRPSGDPFARTCIVVGDMATRNWLQDYFLCRRTDRQRKVLANIDFTPLPEFVNDWLAAQTHSDDRPRKAANHPYSRNVLAWRINAILAGERDARLQPLYDFAESGMGDVEKRRYNLSRRLARLYDDYLISRPELLGEWERGNIAEGEYSWQGVLYNLLSQQCPETYVKDFEAALDPAADLDLAFAHGFPRYEAVHVFDTTFAPKVYLDLLKRVAEKLPVTFWNFNPLRADWREGTEPKDKLLLGALASGAEGVANYQRETPGGVAWLGGEVPFESLRAVDVEVHACHSPRRELEVIRNGILEFMARNEYARPRDVLVLCADWATYSPLVEAVFGSPGDDGYVPISMRSGIAEESPIKHAFLGLLDFGRNNFEVNAVLDLLAVDAVRRKFEIDTDQLGLLRDLVREANIHWGYDDEPGEEPRPYTWRRGLDRLALDALMGERENTDALENAGCLGRIRPCGHVESERAEAVGRLDAFVRRLHELSQTLEYECTYEEWRDSLFAMIDGFFAPVDDEVEQLAELRRAIGKAARDVKNACRYNGLEDGRIPSNVFIASVLSGIKNKRPAEPVNGDAVSFAALTPGSATPAKFVWVCGLNDGAFPKSGVRAAFDLIGQSPTPFDTTPRDRDLFAILKAAFGARKRLALSYIGKNVRSNENLPPSVSLTDIAEWFGKGRVKRYSHPLQSYSPRYFLPPAKPEEELPLNFSKADRSAAENLMRVATGELTPVEPKGIAAFPIGHEIDIDEIVEFFKRPSTYLKRNRLRVRDESPDKDVLDDMEAIEVKIPTRYKIELNSSPPGTVDKIDSEALVEMGLAPDAESVEMELEKLVAEEAADPKTGKMTPTKYAKVQRRTLDIKDAPEFSCTANAVEMLARMKRVEYVPENILSEYDGREVGVRVRHRAVAEGGNAYAMFYNHYKPKEGDTSPEAAEMAIRHVAGHAAGFSFVSISLFGDGTFQALLPMSQEEARAKWNDVLALMFEPLPPELPDLTVKWQDDKLPQPLFDRLVSGLTFHKSSIARKGKADK